MTQVPDIEQINIKDETSLSSSTSEDPIILPLEDERRIESPVKVKKKRYKLKYNNIPQENTMPGLEIKKMRQGMSYSCKEKTIILNVFKYFRNQNPEKCVTDIVRRTAKATGCSEKSIFQFRKEESSVEGFKEPSKTKIRKNININSRDIKYDYAVRSNIRNIIYDLQYKNIVPSLNTILKQINNDKQMPKFSVMTLRRLMYDMGFSYQKNGNKFILVEKPDNRLTIPPNSNMNHSEMNNTQFNQLPPTEINNQQHNQLQLNNQMQQHQLKNSLPPPPSVQTDLNLTHSQLHKPPQISHNHNMTPLLPPSIPQPDHTLMSVGSHQDIMQHHTHLMQHHKNMPQMLMNQRRDVIHPHPGPVPVSSIDMNRKREAMHSPWMHGIIKQGQ